MSATRQYPFIAVAVIIARLVAVAICTAKYGRTACTECSYISVNINYRETGHRGNMSRHEWPEVAFYLSLFGGALIILGGVIMAFWATIYNSMPHIMMMPYLCPMCWMMGGFGFSLPLIAELSIVSAASGILVLVGAIMLQLRPMEHTSWGIMILIFSMVSLAGMGGFIVGALLGIIGGAFALSWRPHKL